MMSEMCLLLGVIVVASNPSPYYGALGLVGGAGGGCLVLMKGGVPFLSLVLFLVYLGGMMVVFAYCAALVAEPYPEAFGRQGVMVGLVLCCMMQMMEMLGVVEYKKTVGSVLGWGMKNEEMWGVTMLYSGGGYYLGLVGWGLLVTLFVVFEVVHGQKGMTLKSV
uniref:NADH-ubiquinone oxidoreductase chain 6 n=1 Tax=Occidozyga martensii TaxID=146711 RepID=E3T245_9NEOB|nr:NADH dehydrogenase subunit 6 [Occidozyga martensii]ACZ02647.1 NADH dehydrogenase subunit 6 [Occidozyga martensii]